MQLFVAVTDYDWFQVHASRSDVEEVNFWQPSPDSSFKALSPGEPLLFKLLRGGMNSGEKVGIGSQSDELMTEVTDGGFRALEMALQG